MIRRLHLGHTLGALLVGTMVLVSGLTDAHRYFDRQMHDAAVFAEHSAAATFAGRALAELPPTTRVLMDERLVGHPTIQFLAKNAPTVEGYAPHLLPLTTASDTALFLGGDQTPETDVLRRLYPNAIIKTFSSPHGGPILLRQALVASSDVTAIQGLDATCRPADGSAPLETRVASPDVRWDQVPRSAPCEAHFEGALYAPAFGDYVLQVDGPTTFDLRIDRQPLAANGQAVHVTLARGVHHLDLTATLSDSSQVVRLLWQPPSAGQLSPIPHTHVFASPAVEAGLLGHYYRDRAWSGPMALQQIDPFISMYFHRPPLPVPFSVEWVGQLAAPIDGVYRFEVTSIDSSQVFIDEREAHREAPVTLAAGWHAIRVRYEAHSGHLHVELRWQPPGRDWEVVPSASLSPSGSAAEVQTAPEPPARRDPEGQLDVAAQPTKLLTPVWQFEPGAGSRPGGVAVDTDGNVYIVESARNTLFKLDGAGRVLWTADPPAGTAGFDQLSAVAVASDGGALVVDGESGVISRFTPGGEYAGVFAQGNGVYHPRGLAVGPSNGDVYLADTGGGRALHLGADGVPLGQIGGRDSPAAGLSQPTGVAITSEGDVIVVDPVARKVLRFAASGATVVSWDFAAGRTINGPQITLDRSETIWVSDTEAGRLETYSIDGLAVGHYQPDGGLVNPSGVAAGDGYVIVAEPDANRVRKFNLP